VNVEELVKSVESWIVERMLLFDLSWEHTFYVKRINPSTKSEKTFAELFDLKTTK